MKFQYLFLTALFCLKFNLNAGSTIPQDLPPASPFNGLVPTTDSLGNYSFFISGHFHGSSSNQSNFPASTLLANLDKINASDAKMMICLGDLFMDIRNDTANYQWCLFDKLKMPLYNAVGNHDLGGNTYSEKYGRTWFSFTLGTDLHLILDTEKDNGDILRDQLKFVTDQLEFAADYSNIFIYTHRTVWKDSYTEMEGIFDDNTQSLGATNFESELLPVVAKAAQKSSVFWFSGSMGDAPASFFYHRDGTRKITYIATAIRDLPRDAILKVIVKDDDVQFETVSLTGQKLISLEEYGVEYWNSNSGKEPFKWKLLPYYFKSAFTHPYFWYGTAFALMLMLLFRIVRRRFFRRSGA